MLDLRQGSLVALTEQHADLLIQAEASVRIAATDPVQGLLSGTQLAAEAKRLKSPEAAAVALRAASWAARELHDLDTATATLKRGLRIARGAGLTMRTSELLMTRAMLQLEVGRIGSARRDLRLAEPGFGPSKPADFLFCQAIVAHRSGDLIRAANAYRLSLGVVTVDERSLRLKTLSNYGAVLADLGHLDEAENTFSAATDLASQVSAFYEAVVTHNRGLIAVRRGRLSEAMAAFARAESLASEAGMPLAETRLGLAFALDAAGLWTEARRQLDSVIPQLEQAGAALMHAEALMHRSVVAMRQGDPQQALVDARAAKERFRTQNRAVRRATAEVREAQAALACQQYDRDLCSRLRRSASLLRQRGERSVAVEGYLTLGRIEAALDGTSTAQTSWHIAATLASDGPLLLRLQGLLATALASPSRQGRLAQCREGLRQLERYRDSLSSTELRAKAASHSRELIDIGLQEASTGRSLFEWLEMGRSVALAAVGPPPNDELINSDLAELRGINQASEPEGRDEIAAMRAQRRIEERIRRRSWVVERGIHSHSKRMTTSAILERLDGHCLVSYGAVADRIVATVLSRGRVTRHDAGSSEETASVVTTLNFAVRRLVGSPGTELEFAL